MAEGRGELVDRAAWEHTTTLMSTMISMQLKDPKKGPSPRQLNPYYTDEAEQSATRVSRKEWAKSMNLPHVTGPAPKVVKPNG